MLERSSTDSYFNSLSVVYEHFLTQNHIKQSYHKLFLVLQGFTKQVVSKESIVFSNLRSSLNFIFHTYQTNFTILEFVELYDRIHLISDLELADYFTTYWSDINLFIQQVDNVPLPFVNQNRIENFTNRYQKPQRKFTGFIDGRKVVVDSFSPDFIVCEDFYQPSEKNILVQLPRNVKDEPVFSTQGLWKGAIVYLLDIDVDQNGELYPKLIVLEPDYLVDVSSIAECFQDYGDSPLHYLKSKLQLPLNTMHLLIGNFANLVIDFLIGQKSKNQTISFSQIFNQHFLNYPTEHLFCEDINSTKGFLQYQELCQMHYSNIVKVVEKDFVYYGLDKKEYIYLEPSFLSDRYGLQGRLDVLYQNRDLNDKTIVVELKSGSGPYPDTGINVKDNHSSQLYMYFLMLAAIKGISLSELTKGQNIDGFIFYSKLIKGHLRSDHISWSKIQKICQMRNQILINEHVLQSDNINKVNQLIRSLTTDNLISKSINNKFKTILDDQFNNVLSPILKSSALVQSYFFSYFSFIAKEQYLSKCGDPMKGSANSLASMWNMDFQGKVDNYSIMYNLRIKQNSVNTPKKTIVFTIEDSNVLASFRVSDVCVLYPFSAESSKPTHTQIFKCSIVAVSLYSVEVSLRFQQNNVHFFDQHELWALERDFMDSSFSGMYQNLYRFIIAQDRNKSLLLTTTNPCKGEDYGYFNSRLSSEQNRILNNMLSTKDYFILNGPPGTGKTSHIIKEFVEELYTNSSDNILILSYTNRAVDELSEAVLQAVEPILKDSNKAFIRLGSALSCKDSFQRYLLSHIIKEHQCKAESQSKRFNRNSLKKVLDEQRVFLSTVSSITNQLDLLAFKKFDWIIVDEASQILEPQIIGLLAHCKRFILIGDHKQLPAIALQDPQQSLCKNPLLNNIGLYNRRNSLFERLYNFCEVNNLDYSYDTLNFQGRMHELISDFPNRYFYQGKLEVAYKLNNLEDVAKNNLYRQVAEMPFYDRGPHWCSLALSKDRVLFIDVPNNSNASDKTAYNEAAMVVEVLLELQKLYKQNNLPLDLVRQVGIIAPFKSQIALIYKLLQTANIPNAAQLTVDTVERFQGGQRDVIIYCLSVVDPYQLESLINLNDQKDVDRKLNVALTRAKEQLIIIGNATMVSKAPLYKELVEDIKSKNAFYSAYPN